MKKITVRKLDWRIFIINLITAVVPLYFIVSSAYKIQNTVMQTVFVIGALSVLGGINFLIVKSGTYLIDIILTEEEIEILDKDKVVYSSKYTDIENYNTYYFINKKGGYVLRFSGGSNFFCSLLTWAEFSKVSEIDNENYDIIRRTLAAKIPGKKKITGIDYLIKIFSSMPYIFLAIAVMTLIGMLVYIAFYLK